MKKYFSIFNKVSLMSYLLIVMVFAPKNNSSQTLASDPLYKLVFVDEFDSLGVNLDKWEIRWPWGPNLFNTNVSNSPCGVNPIDIAYNYYPPFDDFNKNR